jgi:hypothetical protein
MNINPGQLRTDENLSLVLKSHTPSPCLTRRYTAALATERSSNIHEHLDDFLFSYKNLFYGKIFYVHYTKWHGGHVTKPMILVKPFQEDFFFEM